MKSLGLNRLASTSLAAAGLLLGLALAPAPAAAQAPSGMTAEQACTNDAFRLCNNDIPDRAKVGACLRRNARALSPDCRTFVVGGGGRHYAGRTRAHTRAHAHYTAHKKPKTKKHK